jgi:hypothetical protein
MMSAKAKSTLIALAATLTLLTITPPTQATYNPLSSGTTKLTFAGPFLKVLSENKVKLSATGGATLKNGTVTFPLSGGKFDPTSANGFLEHAGSLFFKAGPRKVPLSSLQLKTSQRHAPLSAKFGGGQLKVASTPKLTVTREEFGDKVIVKTLALSSKVATRLNKKLGLKGAFEAGQLLGSSVSLANPQTVAISEAGKASFVFDPGIAAKLQSLFVAINPIFPAEHPGPFTLPIFGGTISTSASEGTVQSLGAIELIQIGGGQVFLREAWVELGSGGYAPELELTPSPPYPGKLGRAPVGALSLAGAAVSADPGARTVSVTGATVLLGANLASAFNDAFAKPLGRGEVFHAGEVLGSLGFVAVGE